MSEQRVRTQNVRGLDLAIFLSGGVLFLALEQLVDKRITAPIGQATLAFVVVCFILLIMTFQLRGFARLQEHRENVVLQTLLETSSRLGLSVRFVHDVPEVGTGEAYRIARQYIERSSDSLVFLHYSRARRPNERAERACVESDVYAHERQLYHEAVIAAVERNRDKPNFYRRITQFPESSGISLTPERVGEHWITHLRRVLTTIAQHPQSSIGYAKIADVYFPQTFFIIDERYVVWILNATDPAKQIQYVEGALFFEDPNGEFVQFLMRLFLRVERNARLISLAELSAGRAI